MHTVALHSLLACVFSLLQTMPMARRRRDAIPNRQYDVFQSTGYSTVTMGELWQIGNMYVYTHKFVCMYVCMWALHYILGCEQSDHLRRLHVLMNMYSLCIVWLGANFLCSQYRSRLDKIHSFTATHSISVLCPFHIASLSCSWVMSRFVAIWVGKPV